MNNTTQKPILGILFRQSGTSNKGLPYDLLFTYCNVNGKAKRLTIATDFLSKDLLLDYATDYVSYMSQPAEKGGENK
ncbi:MAG: hypothetical protein FWD49_07075 [Firmicutes bacterium]|nr:hypothetical protein [Bacillota bacterium]